MSDIWTVLALSAWSAPPPHRWKGLSRNSEYYPNPSVFDPEGYLKQPPELDPREYFFGFGRRICAWKELAFQFVWIMAASILWAFQLVGEEEDRLSSAEDLSRFSFETLSRPMPFKCRFVPRREGLKDRLGLSTG
ncbi:hypothetical protein M407DRAFT_23179 [Tulasnella calospora MUT 4182]|uniref:Cytochrome P450 n=1 Tax=Tulasnella calospora MUT 4182 TaxID=1051891 RepID=A0A0C3M1L9_9AGAM|nr:hypothetical protein M407DRAFT_23179 [Tulasnella calospora MUT 4182]